MDVRHVQQPGLALIDLQRSLGHRQIYEVRESLSGLSIYYFLDLGLQIQRGVEALRTECGAEWSRLEQCPHSHLDGQGGELLCHLIAQVGRLISMKARVHCLSHTACTTSLAGVAGAAAMNRFCRETVVRMQASQRLRDWEETASSSTTKIVLFITNN